MLVTVLLLIFCLYKFGFRLHACCNSSSLFRLADNGKLQLLNTEQKVEEFHLDFNTILAFCTGASHPPATGFMKKPTIAFNFSSLFPLANTCANTLYLPLVKSYEAFAYNMAFGILNAVGLGSV